MISSMLLLKGRQSTEAEWSIADASYDSKSFNLTDQSILSGRGIYIKPDGTKLYVADDNNVYIYQFTLSTAWDISTSSYDSKFYDVTATSTLKGVWFHSDGLKMYLLEGNGTWCISQHTLSTAWDVSTASADSKTLYVYNQTSTNLIGFTMSADGSKAYVTRGTRPIYQYNLSTAWDVSTGSYASKSFSPTVAASDVKFSPSGKKMFTLNYGYTNKYVCQHTLSTAWDISTASYDSVYLNLGTHGNYFYGLFMNGTKLYANRQDGANRFIYQYSL